MTLDQEDAINNWGAIVVIVFGIMLEIMVGVVVLMSLCAQRYDKDEQLNISFANDMRRLSVAKLTDHQFHRKLIRYARYSLSFQWLFYFICHILILIHEFEPEPVLIDHFVYIFFLLNLTMLFLTFRNIGIYYFFPFTDDKSFPNPIRRRQIEIERGQIELIDDDKKKLDKINENGNENEDDDGQDKMDEEEEQKMSEMRPTSRNGEPLHTNEDDEEDEDEDEDNANQNGHSHEHGTRRFSHNHYNDPDLMPDAHKKIKKTGDEDWDIYNQEKFKIRGNFVHLFRSIAYTSIIYWVGYVIATIHGKNDVVLATLGLADILFAILFGCHMKLCKQLINLFNKYSKILDGYDSQCDELRENRIFQLDRWFKADIGIICVLMIKCIVMFIRISMEISSFSWPSSHPVFLATTFVIIASCQMTMCRYIWLTKTD